MFLDKKTFFSLIGVSVFGGCWTQAWSLIADLSCLYHIWGVSDTYVNNQKYNVLDRKFLTLSLLPCPPKSLWSLFCAFSFYHVWCRVVKSNPWVTTAEVSVGTPDTARSCISRRLRRSRSAQAGNVLGFHAQGQSDVTLKVCYCHRAQCVTQNAAVHTALLSQWPSLAVLWWGWVGFL